MISKVKGVSHLSRELNFFQSKERKLGSPDILDIRRPKYQRRA